MLRQMGVERPCRSVSPAAKAALGDSVAIVSAPVRRQAGHPRIMSVLAVMNGEAR